jgi:hypothetical protein
VLGASQRRRGPALSGVGTTAEKRERIEPRRDGWRNNGEKRYLWALAARNFVFYTVSKTRSSAVLRSGNRVLLYPTFTADVRLPLIRLSGADAIWWVSSIN